MTGEQKQTTESSQLPLAIIVALVQAIFAYALEKSGLLDDRLAVPIALAAIPVGLAVWKRQALAARLQRCRRLGVRSPVYDRHAARELRDLAEANERLLRERTAALEFEQKFSASMTDQIDEMRAEEKRLQDRLEDVERTSRRRREQIDFGQELLEMSPLPAALQPQVRITLQEFQVHVGDLYRRSRELWDAIGLRVDASDNREAVIELHLRIFHNEFAYFARLARSLSEVLFNSTRDPRPYLLAMYLAYREWRTAAAKLTKMTGATLVELPPYGAWRAEEQQFWAEWRRKMAIDALAKVRERAGSYDAEHGAFDRLGEQDAQSLNA